MSTIGGTLQYLFNRGLNDFAIDPAFRLFHHQGHHLAEISGG